MFLYKVLMCYEDEVFSDVQVTSDAYISFV